MTIELKAEYLGYLTEMINDLDYSNIDCFAEEHELDEDDINELLSLDLEIVIKEQG